MLRNRLNQLLALFLQNRDKPRRYEVRTSADEATIYLYDLIDPFFGVGAAQFVRDLAMITAPTIHLRINSPGGDVWDGRAIATALRGHSAKVIAHVDALAASAATFAMMAADEVVISPGAMVMIHQASTMAYGNADEIRQTVALLEKVDGEIVSEYVRETGNTEDKVRAWMKATTWFNADEAIAAGFADRLEADGGGTAPTDQWDLSVFGLVEKSPGQPARAVAPEPDVGPDWQHARAHAARYLRTRGV